MSFLSRFVKADQTQNWYDDKYVTVAVQRNFLLLFATFASISLLVCIVAIKKLQESRAIDPYIIEYDKNTGKLSLVESSGKKTYTAQEAVRESLITNYIINREGLKLVTIEDSMNYVRVTTAPKLYEDYTKTIAQDIMLLRSAGKVTKFKIDFLSVAYPSSSRAEIKVNKIFISDGREVSSKKLNISISFTFVELDMTSDDIRQNPLGFQVNGYRVLEEKTFDDNTSNNDKLNNNDNS